MRRVISLGAVVAIADVVKGDFIAIDVRPRELRHIRLPVAVVGRLQCQPPREDECERREDYGESEWRETLSV